MEILTYFEPLSTWIGYIVLGSAFLYGAYQILVEIVARHICISVAYTRFMFAVEKEHGKGTAIRPAFIRKYPRTYKWRIFWRRFLTWNLVSKFNYGTSLSSPYGSIYYKTFYPSWTVKGKEVEHEKDE